MRLTERLIDETRESNKKRAKEINAMSDPDEDDQGMAYMPRPVSGFLNEDKGVFHNADETSINTAKSVFDKTCVFNTKL